MCLIITIVYLYISDVRVGVVFYYYVLQAVSSLLILVGAIEGVGELVFIRFGLKVGLFPTFMWVVNVV